MLETRSLVLNKDFKRLYSRGKSLANRHCVIYAMKNHENQSRLGITVSKKLGNAVKRNRARRLIRESYRLMEADIKRGYDIVIVARYMAVESDQQRVYGAMYDLMRSLGLIKGEK